jgi:hypothetical protein
LCHRRHDRRVVLCKFESRAGLTLRRAGADKIETGIYDGIVRGLYDMDLMIPFKMDLAEVSLHK